MSEGKSWLERRHPKYSTYVGHWEFLRDSYIGEPTFAETQLFKFWREDEDSFKDRVKRAHRYNFTRKIVDIINGYLWQSPPVRSDKLPDTLQAFWADADREGNAINAVMSQKISPWVAIYGRPWVVVDKPREQAATKADEQQRRLFPYMTLVSPADVLDARIVNGTIEWMLLRERTRDDVDPKTSTGKEKEQFRLWTTTEWSVWELRKKEGSPDEAVLIDQGTHDLGEVPIVPLDHRAPITPFVSPSLVGEIAYLDRSIFNHISLLDSILYDVTFPQLRIPWQSIPPGEPDPERPGVSNEEERVLKMATHRAFVYDASSPTAPDWMAPDASPAQTLRDRVTEEIDELFRSMSLAGEMSATVSEASGVSKEHDFRKLSKLLAVMADNLEAGELRILRLAAKWQRIDPATIPDDAVDYPESFDVKTLIEELDEIKEMGAAGLPDLVLNEARKDVTQRRFNKLPPEKLEVLLKAIDEVVGIPVVDLDEEEERQRQQRGKPPAEDDAA